MRPEDWVFIDESGVNRATRRRYARSRVNTRAFDSAPRNGGDNVSILSALTLRGPLQSRCVVSRVSSNQSGDTTALEIPASSSRDTKTIPLALPGR